MAAQPFLHPPRLLPLRKDDPSDIGDLPLMQWDKGVFNFELLQLHLTPKLPMTPAAAEGSVPETGPQIEEGTYGGTQLALTELFGRIDQSFQSWFDINAWEPSIPQRISLEDARKLYRFQPSTKDKYPPHLDVIPLRDEVPEFTIFNKLALVDVALLIPKIVPKTFLGTISKSILEKINDFINGRAEDGFTMAQLEELNKKYRTTGTDIMRGENMGDLPDWYSDARFAQQHFTGTNPTTITKATPRWIQEFKDEANRQIAKEPRRRELAAVLKLVDPASSASLYIQDYSYFRKAIGIQPTEVISSDDRYGCASVCLFQLHPDGKLHPLAIVIDYKGSMQNSVVLFNQRLKPSDSTSGEATDWPWRYAKTCAQVSDWHRHELTIHLTNTHLIEEAIIVATHRQIPTNHRVFQLLQPHWFRTLSVNAGARETLVPMIIFDICGFTADQAYSFLYHAFTEFNFTERYIPTDLESRGFPLADLGTSKLKNYAYAKNMALLWPKIRAFVSSMLALDYKSNADVASDPYIRAWCAEIQSSSGACISSFPSISTLAELIDAVTMCIHIASPQHTAVNYLQNFYQSFVPAKPAALYRPLPTTLAQLRSYTEANLIISLPVGRQRDWLLSAHVPWLLSFKPAEQNNLLNYALSLYNVYKKKTAPKEIGVANAAAAFYNELVGLIAKFKETSDGMDKGTIPYTVMDPGATAVSILM